MKQPMRDEVWLVDLGMTAKVRPCLVISIPPADSDRALTTMIAHTTSVHGSAFEVSIPARYLKQGAFDAQNITTIPRAKLIRQLGALTPSQMAEIESAVSPWIGLTPAAQ
jgi:mRNA interferase MazF